jgi:DNA helicase HerA-like ATPase
MLTDGKIWVGTGDNTPQYLLANMANRHGLIAGATGTGKTVTLKVMAEGFSAMGVPVFLSDIKGDLSGMVRMGENTDKIAARLMTVGVNNFKFETFPTEFWDVYGEQGHPVRTTVSEMGPLLLSRMLNLNDTQIGVLNILFRVADDEGMLLLDIKDVKAMLAYVGENASRYTLNYGNVSKATIGAIQRAVAVLEDQGGDQFFGEPALDISDWMHQDEEGRGMINILSCDKLFLNPLMYSTFLLWMLSELYETLPERGDQDKPRMVFFFDEAHLLFNDCGRQLLEKVEQVVRLIRSKGVGVYFITQNPTDIPMSVLGQLGNRVQHALRAFTPLDQKAVKVAAQTFRPNPSFDTEEAITQLQTGEALISFLDAKGAPSVVNRAIILPPQSYIGAIDEGLRKTFIETSPFNGVYEDTIDRDSAYEYLAATLNIGRPEAPAQRTAPVPAQAPVTAAPPATTFMVFDPATNSYTAKTLDTMSPLPQQQAATPVQAPPPCPRSPRR